ncbi:hypothetical protein FRC12_012839 [Ceratobasidium sp. 428]|nr:hypothetical protein FRC12_012839 [Ceratobasidium sp. 428]
MSNPNYPIPVQGQSGTLPPCPELRDMRNVILVDEETRWYPNLDAATEAALSRGHSEGLAGSGGMLPERLNRFGWGPLPAGAVANSGYVPSPSGQLPNAGHPVSGEHAAAQGVYAPSHIYQAGGYPVNGHRQGGGYPHGGGQTSMEGHPQRGGHPRR